MEYDYQGPEWTGESREDRIWNTPDEAAETNCRECGPHIERYTWLDRLLDWIVRRLK